MLQCRKRFGVARTQALCNYERPAASGGNYAKLEDGANKYRILSEAIVGWQYWNTENKPVRLTERPETIPEDVRMENGKPEKIKHFWAFVVWSYRESKIQILELTQVSIQGPLEDLVMSEDWGDPRGYDITITKKGQKLDTEYTVQPSPHKEAPVEATQMLKTTTVDLKALFRGEDPFGAATARVEREDTQVADNNPFGGDFK